MSNEDSKEQAMEIVYIIRARYLGPDRWAGEGFYFFSAEEAALWMWGKDRADYLITVNGREVTADYCTASELQEAIATVARQAIASDEEEHNADRE